IAAGRRQLPHRSPAAGPRSPPELDDGGDEGSRTLDLRIAHASLYQLSYVPTRGGDLSRSHAAAKVRRKARPTVRFPPRPARTYGTQRERDARRFPVLHQG